MIGNAVLVLKNGKTVEGEFLGRAVFAGIDSSDPRMSFFQAWGVSSISFLTRRFRWDFNERVADEAFRIPAQ